MRLLLTALTLLSVPACTLSDASFDVAPLAAGTRNAFLQNNQPYTRQTLAALPACQGIARSYCVPVANMDQQVMNTRLDVPVKQADGSEVVMNLPAHVALSGVLNTTAQNQQACAQGSLCVPEDLLLQVQVETCTKAGGPPPAKPVNGQLPQGPYFGAASDRAGACLPVTIPAVAASVGRSGTATRDPNVDDYYISTATAGAPCQNAQHSCQTMWSRDRGTGAGLRSGSKNETGLFVQLIYGVNVPANPVPRIQ